MYHICFPSRLDLLNSSENSGALSMDAESKPAGGVYRGGFSKETVVLDDFAVCLNEVRKAR